jgi:hypothetical protein
MKKGSISCAVCSARHDFFTVRTFRKKKFLNLKNFVLRLYLIFYVLQSELYKAVKIFLVRFINKSKVRS